MDKQLQSADWTFLSNHSHVLYCISSWPGIRIRDIAQKVRITERAVQRIVVDLEQGGYVIRKRVGRQNHYRLKPRLHLRHPLEHHVEVGRFLAVLNPRTSNRAVTRGLNAVLSRADAKASSRLKKSPKKLRKRD